MIFQTDFLLKFDTAENEPATNLQNFRKMRFRKMHFSKMHFRKMQVVTGVVAGHLRSPLPDGWQEQVDEKGRLSAA